MPETWTITEPTTRPLPQTRFDELRIQLGGGRIDILTHDDETGGTLEVSDLDGPLSVRADGKSLIIHEGDQPQPTGLRRLFSGASSRHNINATICVTVPKRTKLRVSTADADLLVSGVRADVKLNSARGQMTAEDLVGAIELATASGSIDASKLDGSLKISTASGDATVLDSRLSEVVSRSASGSTTLDLIDGACKVKMRTASGELAVRIPEGTGWDVDFATASGVCSVDGIALNTNGVTRRVRESEGDARLTIDYRSASGNVSVLHAPAQTGSDSDDLRAHAAQPYDGEDRSA